MHPDIPRPLGAGWLIATGQNGEVSPAAATANDAPPLGGDAAGGGGAGSAITASGAAGGAGQAPGGGGGHTTSTGGSGGHGGLVIAIYATSTPTAAGNDYAEMFPVSNPLIGAGDIVAVDAGIPVSMKLAVAGDAAPLAGVISTEPGQVLGDQNATGMRPIALSGRVPAKVNLEGGLIKIGDRIAVSSVPGVGKKAGSLDDSVGIAIDSYDGASGNTVMVFLNLQKGADIDAIGRGLLATSATTTATGSSTFDFVGGLLSNLISRFTRVAATSTPEDGLAFSGATSTPSVDTMFLNSISDRIVQDPRLLTMAGAIRTSGASTSTPSILSLYQGTSTPAMSIDAAGNVGVGTTQSSARLTISGNVLADSYETANMPVTAFMFGSTALTGSTTLTTGSSGQATVTAEMPAAVLTAAGNVDLYKLATYTLSGVSALAERLGAMDIRIVSLEDRMAKLEGATTTSTLATTMNEVTASSTPNSIGSWVASMSSALVQGVVNAISSLGVDKGIASVFGAFDKVFAREVHTDTLCVGEVCVTREQFLKMTQSAGVTPEPAAAPAPSPDTTTATSSTDLTPSTSSINSSQAGSGQATTTETTTPPADTTTPTPLDTSTTPPADTPPPADTTTIPPADTTPPAADTTTAPPSV